MLQVADFPPAAPVTVRMVPDGMFVAVKACFAVVQFTVNDGGALVRLVIGLSLPIQPVQLGIALEHESNFTWIQTPPLLGVIAFDKAVTVPSAPDGSVPSKVPYPLFTAVARTFAVAFRRILSPICGCPADTTGFTVSVAD
jgi:hypothetical protein